MTEDDLKRAEAWAAMVHKGDEPARFAAFATVNDLTAEVRRLTTELLLANSAVSTLRAHVNRLMAGQRATTPVDAGLGEAEQRGLKADNERLRGLLARMDDRNEGLYAYGIRHCPWCSWMNDGPNYTQHNMDDHSPKCPAFNDDGSVK